MMRSLFSGVSGMRNHQVRMDVIGNNISNVNTIGYKANRVTFQEGFASMLQGANRPQGGAGGTNAQQVGLGMQVGSVDSLFTQGSLETTGVTTDLAVQGDSFFLVSKGGQNFYTRAGNFILDANGTLVNASNGAKVQGRMATNGEFSSDIIGDITLPVGQKAPAEATSNIKLGGNLNSDGTSTSSSITIYDSLGGTHELVLTMTKTAPNTWSVTASSPDGSFNVDSAPSEVVFGNDGLIDMEESSILPIQLSSDDFEFDTITVDLGQGTLGGLTQFSGTTTAALQGQDGYTYGVMTSYSIDRTGTLIGAFSNGVNMVMGQIALADFNNPGGLLRAGDNLFTTSANSGDANVAFSGEGSSSEIASGALEMSNVDLTQEFTSMIVAQRGFQANSRVISNADEMLQELINLKR